MKRTSSDEDEKGNQIIKPNPNSRMNAGMGRDTWLEEILTNEYRPTKPQKYQHITLMLPISIVPQKPQED